MNIEYLKKVCSETPKLPPGRQIKTNKVAWEWEKDELGNYFTYAPAGKVKTASCQRTLDKKFVNRIVENFIPSLYKGVVGYYDKGYIYGVDSQHSTAAVCEKFGKDVLVG